MSRTNVATPPGIVELSAEHARIIVVETGLEGAGHAISGLAEKLALAVVDRDSRLRPVQPGDGDKK